ncbi:cell division protein FtsZ [Sphingomicrobium astaxanthinifaciens]|uniref:cell division protein FtsZ n=1 Tax=Sphingomicrobium astaxanthinifaciens TaxID=1227949 RepID=UPI001FCCB610|nr:cell division protein FtsZ [Sphingomicrobium astaxanthinifaciens]MCJ7421645.1 cell division protein FtsZ [Sphingomicrobium astaxanthinifaciens]
MSIDFQRPEVDELRPRISVVGVGGAGGNAIANMMGADVQGVEFLVANTDAQALNASAADTRLQLGLKITQGLGAGSRPEIGRAAAEETIEEIERALEGSHMVFVAAGMGGGTGTGAAPVIAKAARAKGILTVGVVTKPFAFEGARRGRAADSGIEELQQHVDTLIVIPNQNLFRLATPDTTFKEAFEMADEVLQQGVRGITDLMVMPGLINLDFADVRSVMSEMGKAMMGTGEAEGENRAIEAAEKAISNPLLDGVSMKGAKGVIISITGGMDMKLMEVDEAASHIKELVDEDANIIWGSAFNDDLEGKIRVSVVATGIDGEEDVKGVPQSASTSQSSVFTFPGARGGQPPATPSIAPKASFSIDNATAAAARPTPGAKVEEEALDLTDALASEDEREDDDPLMLESDDILAGPVSAPPVAPPADDVAETDAEEEDDMPSLLAAKGNARKTVPTPPPGGGGTLFERMSNIARGAQATGEEGAQDEPGFGAESFDIPGFLNRKNN